MKRNRLTAKQPSTKVVVYGVTLIGWLLNILDVCIYTFLFHSLVVRLDVKSPCIKREREREGCLIRPESEARPSCFRVNSFVCFVYLPLVVVVVVSFLESPFLSAHSIGIGNDPDAMSLLNAYSFFSLSLPPFLSVLQSILLSSLFLGGSLVGAEADSFNGRNQTVISPFFRLFSFVQ